MAETMTKFGFKIRTRGGLIVDNLAIAARDRAEAERKLAQMYHNCEVLECQAVSSPAKEESLNLENVISLIGKEPGPAPSRD